MPLIIGLLYFWKLDDKRTTFCNCLISTNQSKFSHNDFENNCPMKVVKGKTAHLWFYTYGLSWTRCHTCIKGWRMKETLGLGWRGLYVINNRNILVCCVMFDTIPIKIFLPIACLVAILRNT